MSVLSNRTTMEKRDCLFMLDSSVFWNEMIEFVKKQKVSYTLTSIAPNWCYITAVWVAKIDSADRKAIVSVLIY